MITILIPPLAFAFGARQIRRRAGRKQTNRSTVYALTYNDARVQAYAMTTFFGDIA